ncbi:DNA-dependent metalloprotease SPRTN [Microcaecilia unicolor]|uniref:DNA-dependent metalloprotease SPRTN n=1 Tax=Microcaecilia unicolor TaxID=1415580 RepID=A0A6P7XIT1_9AMPH|nr:sprT-like domain-containing protein Spartan [Microcaecilia unicolor]
MEQDLRLARRLQEQYDREIAEEEEGSWGSRKLPPVSAGVGLSVVDPAWELLDPSPDVRALFLQFNSRFFWGKLGSVEVKWSPRMTLCAGVCSYEGRGGLCSIRLSEPLLKLRPRKDLVETLLHEMIHALLFVTNNDKDHDSHGSEFCKHMHRINGMAGSNITIYHSFHDEVDEYRKHWWRCNGPCQNRKPYFGYVKRAMNRPPSVIDPWWADHQKTCGGTFLKIKEPENYSTKKREKNKLVHPQSSKPSENKGKTSGIDRGRSIVPFSGKGYLLGKSSDSSLSERIPSLTETTGYGSGSSLKIPLSPNTNLPVSYVTSTDSNKLSSTKKRLPKASVGNTKFFKNVNGSPVKIFPIFNKRERSNPNSEQFQQAILTSDVMQVRVPYEVTPREKATSELGEPTSIKDTSKQSKYPRMDDKSASANLFVKASDDAGNRYRTSVLRNYLGNTDEQVASPSSSNSQDTSVTCPVCRTDVLESKINEHLDSCLVVC